LNIACDPKEGYPQKRRRRRRRRSCKSSKDPDQIATCMIQFHHINRKTCSRGIQPWNRVNNPNRRRMSQLSRHSYHPTTTRYPSQPLEIIQELPTKPQITSRQRKTDRTTRVASPPQLCREKAASCPIGLYPRWRSRLSKTFNETHHSSPQLKNSNPIATSQTLGFVDRSFSA
jgi:hypothetical protein